MAVENAVLFSKHSFVIKLPVMDWIVQQKCSFCHQVSLRQFDSAPTIRLNSGIWIIVMKFDKREALR